MAWSWPYLPGAGGGDAIRNILSGQADVAFTDPGSFFMALDKGEKLVAIYDIYPQNVFNVVSLKSSGIRKPADLKGKKIGVYSLASGTRQNLLVMLHPGRPQGVGCEHCRDRPAELCSPDAGTG